MNRRVLAKLSLAALLLGLVPLASELLLVPLHREGAAQPILSPINALGRMLGAPGFVIAEISGLRGERFTTALGAVVASAVASITYFLILLVLHRLWTWTAAPKAKAEKAESDLDAAPLRLSRRGLLRGGMQLTSASCAAVAGYSLAYEPNTLQIRQLKVPIRDLPASLSGLRIAQLTDIHHCAWHTTRFLRSIVETTNALKPDLVALTGDYVARSPDYIKPVAEAMAHLQPRIGTVGTLGNHDWWEDAQRTVIAFAACGIPMIDNKRMFITPERKLAAESSTGLCIAGVGDLWTDVCNFDAALGGVPAAMPRILLSHNPDAAEEPRLLKSDHRIDLMLSGHTHGGQVRLPLIGAPVTNSRFGSKYAAGLVQGPRCPVFICCGIGTTVLPIRLGVPPEIAVIELQRA